MEYMSGGELYKRLSSRKRYSEVGERRWEISHGQKWRVLGLGLGFASKLLSELLPPPSSSLHLLLFEPTKKTTTVTA